jgi:manganese/zinc/iron transport system permease protein
MALMGDALSHAVLPGVALGFLWNVSRDPWAIFIGATLAGLLGTATVFAITHTTRLKEDTALGMVLAAFFGLGMCLVSMIQRLPSGNQSGIDSFLFGQAAAIGPQDLLLMAAVTSLILVVITLGYKEFLLVSFDPGFARVCSLPTRWLHHVLMLLLAFAVVIALQAVGVVLVSAMLITPAATASLLTHRFHRMLFLSGVIGSIAGIVGAFFSFLGSNLSTGPFIVLSATFLFTAAFLLAPRRGVITRWWQQLGQRQRVFRENTLKAVYQILEAEDFRGESVSLRELAERRKCTLEEADAQSRALARHDLATRRDDGLALTPEGWQRACAIVRNHRLWELYLTHAADIAPDHVHEDAEKIEHVLGEDVVRLLERRLEFADTDPHGKPIPGLRRMQERGLTPPQPGGSTGYSQRNP